MIWRWGYIFLGYTATRWWGSLSFLPRLPTFSRGFKKKYFDAGQKGNDLCFTRQTLKRTFLHLLLLTATGVRRSGPSSLLRKLRTPTRTRVIFFLFSATCHVPALYVVGAERVAAGHLGDDVLKFGRFGQSGFSTSFHKTPPFLTEFPRPWVSLLAHAPS